MDHQHQAPRNTPYRTPKGRVVWAACIICGSRIFWRRGNKARPSAWIEKVAA